METVKSNSGVIKLSQSQISFVASECSKKFGVTGCGGWQSITEYATGQQSINGGKYNFASYNFMLEVQIHYLAITGQTYGQCFDWYTCGVEYSEAYKAYLFNLKSQVADAIKNCT